MIKLKDKKNNRGFTRQNFKRKIPGGFTLVELIIAIAVIGILAVIVLGFLISSKNKAKDTAAMVALEQARVEAKFFYYKNNNSYRNVCSGLQRSGEDGFCVNDPYKIFLHTGTSSCPQNDASFFSSPSDMPSTLANIGFISNVFDAKQKLIGNNSASSPIAVGAVGCNDSFFNNLSSKCNTGYALSIKLNDDFYCVDSTGFAGKLKINQVTTDSWDWGDKWSNGPWTQAYGTYMDTSGTIFCTCK